MSDKIKSQINHEQRLQEYELKYYLCEYCGQMFPHSDPFYAHRMASDVDGVKEINVRDGFSGVVELNPGDKTQEGWTLGSEPCSGEYYG